MKSFLFIFLMLHLLYNFSVRSWKFEILGLNEDKIELSRIAVYYRRAFIAIPRVYDEQPFTLVEVPWPERSINTIYNTKPFPPTKTQTLGECDKLQSVVTLEVDTKGRLYVLDKGLEDFCSPKIVIYDLRTNKELLQKELKNVPSDNLNAMVIDLNVSNRDLRLILSDAGNHSLLVYNFNKQMWWRLTVKSANEVENGISEDESWQSGFNQLALSPTNLTLYATSSQFPELYSIDLNEFRNLEEPLPYFGNWYDYNGTEISVKYEGNKFGKSTGMFADFKGNLFYVYERDYVILKWNPSKPFATENVEVVLQNYSLIPYPVQIFAEPYYQLWVLNSKRNEKSSFIVKLKP